MYLRPHEGPPDSLRMQIAFALAGVLIPLLIFVLCDAMGQVR